MTAATALAFCVSTGIANARVYSNPEFGMRILIPAGLPFCSEVPAEAHDYGLGVFRPRDHGPNILLDPKDRGHCRDVIHRRSFQSFAFYNAVDDDQTLEGLAAFACRAPDDAVGQCRRAPAGLGLKGWRTYSHRRARKGGWIDIDVVAQVGASPHDKQPEGVNFIFTLTTRADHLDEDLVTFRKILNSVRLWRTTTPDA